MSWQLTLEHISALYTFGRFQYTYGNYSGAADYLYHFRILSTDPDLNLSAHWGKLACDILSGNWDTALEELNSLREAIDSRTASPSNSIPTPTSESALAQLQSRTWLLHWSLFVYFNHAQGRTLLLETFLSPAYLNTIQTSCPWILRYLAAAAIVTRKVASTTSGRTKHALKEIVRIIQMEEYQYKDPVTQFLRELYIEFDFEAAQKSLAIAEQVTENDFFLVDLKQEFLDNARYLISEAYCRIHQKIDIEYVFHSGVLEWHDLLDHSDLSTRLNLSQEEGEKWIVNLIRDMRMGADAKIDLEKVIFRFNISKMNSILPIECYSHQPTPSSFVSNGNRENSRVSIPYTGIGGSYEQKSSWRSSRYWRRGEEQGERSENRWSGSGHSCILNGIPYLPSGSYWGINNARTSPLCHLIIRLGVNLAVHRCRRPPPYPSDLLYFVSFFFLPCSGSTAKTQGLFNMSGPVCAETFGMTPTKALLEIQARVTKGLTFFNDLVAHNGATLLT